MPNLFDLGLGAAGYATRRGDIEDAASKLERGFTGATGAIKEAYQPYAEFGERGIQPYEDLGDFQFAGEDLYRDPSYQFRLQEGLRGVERSRAAQKMLQSGGTLAALQTRGQQEASQEYQAAFDRALRSREETRATREFPLRLGAETAGAMGTNLADIAIGRGASQAQIELAKSRALTGGLASLVGDRARGGAPAGAPGAGGAPTATGLFRGGGADQTGQWGVLGDIGAAMIGRAGQDVNLSDLFSRAQAAGVDPAELTAAMPELQRLQETAGIDYGKGSFFEGLDEASIERVASGQDAGFWKGFQDFAGGAWDTISGSIGGLVDAFNPFN